MTWEWLPTAGVVIGFFHFAETIERHLKRSADSLVVIEATLTTMEHHLSSLDSE